MFTRTKYQLLILVGMLILLSACGGGKIKINDTDNGRPVAAKVGQTIVLELNANPTTGYSWQINQIDTTILQQVGEVQYDSDSTLLGSGGTETIIFEVIGSGATTLMLNYQRPWEEGIAPIDVFILHITVK